MKYLVACNFLIAPASEELYGLRTSENKNAAVELEIIPPRIAAASDGTHSVIEVY